MPKQPSTARRTKVRCKDCGRKYQAGAPHTMFCPAHTCNECGTSFGYVLPPYDSRTKPITRLCDNCLNERLDAEEAEDA